MSRSPDCNYDMAKASEQSVLAKPTRCHRPSKRSQPWWVRRWHYLHYRLSRLRGTPNAIARGLAVGVFAGCFPLLGLQTLIGVLLAIACRGNKFAAAVGTWVSNPLTYVPIFAFNFKVGRWLLGLDPVLADAVDWQALDVMQLGTTLLWSLFLGCFVVGAIAATCSYFLCVRSISRLQHLRRHKRSE